MMWCERKVPGASKSGRSQDKKVDEAEFIKSRGITVQDFGWDQNTANLERPLVAKSSACVYLQSYLALPALINGSLPEASQESVAKLVGEYDASGRHCAGTFPRKEIDCFSDSHEHIKFRVVEGHVGKDGCLQLCHDSEMPITT